MLLPDAVEEPAMQPALERFGICASAVVTLDGVGLADRATALSDEIGAFPNAVGSLYPGVRRLITSDDAESYAYVEQLCETAAPYVAGAFDTDGFTLLEASFSIVSTPPRALRPPQRAPHFDSTDPRYLALLHYLRLPAATGTAFYRQRATGIEQVSDDNLETFVRTAKQQAAMLGDDAGYIQGSNADYEQIGAIDARPDRLLIYQGCLLHSGIIPPDMPMTDDPHRGRLTANLFVRIH